jgi:hypothetical protein
VRAAPFHKTDAPETKLLPLTVSVNAEPPAVVLLGESELSAGAVAAAAATVNGNALDALDPGLSAVTWAVPAAEMSAAVMAAVT